MTDSSRPKTQLRHALDIASAYWLVYGGWKALLKSPFFWLAVAITAITIPFWTESEWWQTALAVLPSLLGFSLACFAMLVGFGDERFRRMVAGSDSTGFSPFLAACATFAHFIVVQVSATMLALLSLALDFNPAQLPSILQTDFFSAVAPLGWGLGFLLFAYSLSLVFAAVGAIFRLASWFDQMVASDNTTDDDEPTADTGAGRQTGLLGPHATPHSTQLPPEP